ncbi:MAG: glycosyltransferase family 4 protein [Acidobacteriota bacterium]
MRVVLTGDFPQDGQVIRGGVQAAFAYLAHALSEIPGIELHVITRQKERGTAPSEKWTARMRIHYLPASPRFQLARDFKDDRQAFNRELAKIRPDVVHAHDATDYGYAAVRCGYPAVVTAHGIRREASLYYGRFRLRARNYVHSLLIERYIMRHTWFLIAISRYVTDYFRHSLRPDVQVHYINNAIDERFFQPRAEAQAPPVVLYAGRVIPRKRIEDLVRAFARVALRVPGSRLKIAGETDSEPDYAASIRQLAAACGVSDRTDFLGQLTETRILEEFRRSSVLALASAQETAPMVIAQAQAGSLPVVATSVGGVAEMIEDGKTGFLVPVREIGILAERLERLLAQPSMADDIGRRAHRFAKEQYSADRIAQRTFGVYERLIEMSRSRVA